MASPVRIGAAFAALALCAPAPAGARGADRHLWATVNVCDTLAHPDTIGIRGSMPGTGDPAQRMFMRFQVQFFSATDEHWHRVQEGGDSGFVDVGSARLKALQAGRLFVFAPPAGGSFQLRGIVTFEWRAGKRLVRRARQATTAGHHADQSDPPGYSSDTCVIS
jgi:hypothetical protein